MTEERGPAPDRRLREVEAVIVGMGWAGAIMAAELTRAGISVVGLERGPTRDPESDEYTRKHDELRFRVRHALMQDVTRESWTFRHDLRETALPFRYLGAFLPGTGVGGSALHYGGTTARFAPWEFEAKTQTLSRYGAAALPDGCTLQDWGMTFGELEPFYDRFEYMAGVAGTAGNVEGRMRPGGNPFEGSRRREYPLPPLMHGAAGMIFENASRAVGYHPFPVPLAVLSEEYTNPEGLTRGPCAYCGDCTHYVCAVDARADPCVTSLRLAEQTGLFELRANSTVLRVLHDEHRATGILYQSADGRIYEQPATVVALTAFTFGNVRLLLLSGMGRPYDVRTGNGEIGRNYSYNVHARGSALYGGRRLKNYVSAGAGSVAIADLAADNFDHRDVGFVGGAWIQVSSGGGPITGVDVPADTPQWGRKWKQAVRRWYDRNLRVVAVGNVLPYDTNFMDLDPTYRDCYGDPLLRITFDWGENERALARFAEGRIRAVLTASQPNHIVTSADAGHFDTGRYQGTHNTGGVILGADPSISAVNSYLQMWDYANVWVVGGSAFPQNGTPGPTGTICALAYRAAARIAALHAPGASARQ